MNAPAFVDFSLDFILWVVSCAHKLKIMKKITPILLILLHYYIKLQVKIPTIKGAVKR
jgi:hypothetical protein